MLIRAERSYRIVVRFPWGERREFWCEGVSRDSDGTIRWTTAEGEAGYLDSAVEEREGWVRGWHCGCADVAVVVSEGPEAPEP